MLASRLWPRSLTGDLLEADKHALRASAHAAQLDPRQNIAIRFEQHGDGPPNGPKLARNEPTMRSDQDRDGQGSRTPAPDGRAPTGPPRGRRYHPRSRARWCTQLSELVTASITAAGAFCRRTSPHADCPSPRRTCPCASPPTPRTRDAERGSITRSPSPAACAVGELNPTPDPTTRVSINHPGEHHPKLITRRRTRVMMSRSTNRSIAGNPLAQTATIAEARQGHDQVSRV